MTEKEDAGRGQGKFAIGNAMDGERGQWRRTVEWDIEGDIE